MNKRAEEAALKAYPIEMTPLNYQDLIEAFGGKTEVDVHSYPRALFREGYEVAENDIIEHCEKRIAEYNAQNLSNMFLRRAFEDVIRFIKGIPYEDYEEDEI